MANNTQQKHDPIRDHYFKSLRAVDDLSGWLFYIAAALSFTALLVDKEHSHRVYDLVQVLFVLAVIAVFVIGLVIRLYLTPRAEDMRRKDLISKTYGVLLTHKETIGYYNNDQTTTKFLGFSVMENSFFSKEILLEMAKFERLKVGAYALFFIIVVLNRNTDLAVASTAAVAVFSEQVFSRWLRLEWLCSRCETTYSNLYNLFQSSPTSPMLQAKVLEAVIFYETSKSNGGITLSEKIFLKLNQKLSEEWESIKLALENKQKGE